MRYFYLRFEDHEVEIPPGQLLVGRSEECGLMLDDDRVSRRHAAFHATESQLFVEDLQSRNGVLVNRVEIRGRVELNHGDVVTIGDQRLEVCAADRTTIHAPRRTAVTLPGTLPDRPTALGSRSVMLEDAFAAGDLVAVEHILGPLLHGTLVEIQSGRLEPTLLADVTRHALRLADASEKSAWIDWVFLLHHSAQRVLPTPAVDELHVVARKVRYGYTTTMRAYVEGVQARVASLSPPERFALQRLEGLVRVLRGTRPV